MTNDQNNTFFDFVSFLKKKDPRFEEVDTACLSHEHFVETKSRSKISPLYFFLMRNRESKMTVEQMKKSFGCGAKLIQDVKEAIERRNRLLFQVARRSNL